MTTCIYLVHFDDLTSCSVCEVVKLVNMSSRIARSPSLKESGTITPTAEPGNFVNCQNFSLKRNSQGLFMSRDKAMHGVG